MSDNKGLLTSGLGMVGRNKRYIVWFWLLNLALAFFGSLAFSTSAHTVLDRSLISDRLVHGFDFPVMAELFGRPEFGQMAAMSIAAVCFSILFFLANVLFLPGVFQGYASTYRLPREDFFRACGRNLWRYIRLLFVAGLVMGIATGALFGIHGVLERKAAESTNELLLPEVRGAGLAIIFLIMTCFRIWFDLAEIDVVLSDQRAVRKSIGLAFRHTLQSLVRMLASYVVATLAAAVVLAGGLWMWMKLVSPESVAGAFIVGQLTLLLLLIPRFWQRGAAVSYWKQKMMVPVVATQPNYPVSITPRPISPLPISPVAVQQDAPSVPDTPPTAQGF